MRDMKKVRLFLLQIINATLLVIGLLQISPCLGCSPCTAEIKGALIDLTTGDVATNTYNFATASAWCETTEWLDDHTEEIDSYEWSFENAPPATTSPDIIEISENAAAFLVPVAGSYTLAVRITCVSDNGASASTTVRETFEANDVDVVLRSTSTLAQSEGESLEQQKSDLLAEFKSVFPDTEHWYIYDFNRDSLQEALLVSDDDCFVASYGDEIGELFTIDNEFCWPLTNSHAIIGASPDSEVESKTHIYAIMSDFISEYVFDYDLQEIELEKTIDDWVYGALAVGVDITSDGQVDFLKLNDQDLGALFSIDADSGSVSELGPVYILLSEATFIDNTDTDNDGHDEIVYKIGSEYFVYEY